MQIQRYGIDPSAIEANITLPDATTGGNNLGVLTPEMRQNLINWTGYDPLNPSKMTLSGQKATQDIALGAQNIEMGGLQLDVAKNPYYGLGAQARAAIEQANATVEKLKLDVEKAKKEVKNGGLTAKQQYDIEMELAEATKKAQETEAKGYMDTFGVTQNGAMLWAIVKGELEGESKGMKREDFNQQVLRPLLAQNKLPRKDRDWLLTMYAGFWGDPVQSQLDALMGGGGADQG
jgi:hypothetical protein